METTTTDWQKTELVQTVRGFSATFPTSFAWEKTTEERESGKLSRRP